MSNLLHPELFEQVPMLGGATAERLEERVTEASRAKIHGEGAPPISIAIRTLNEADTLEDLLQDIESQDYDGEVEVVVVVDNESTDGTADVAKDYGSEVVTLPRHEFTHPKSMNLGVQASSHELVVLTVGHALLSNDQALTGSARHFMSSLQTAGTFAHALPNSNASRTERFISLGNILYLGQPKSVKKPGIGVLAATGAMIAKEAWKELGRFDEDYETGGEDTRMAKLMLERGCNVIEEPTLSVHHTHGLGPVNYWHQLRRWMKSLDSPQQLDLDKYLSSRPDLNNN